jgi:hypothetical protein
VCSVSGTSAAVPAEAEIGYKIVHDSGVMSAAEWRRASGTLKLAVRNELGTGATTKFSFRIKNAMAQQTKQPVFIMASGMTPIGSVSMTGTDIMEISGTSTTVTKVCQASTGECTAAFVNLPVKPLFTLSAEIQCNAKASNVAAFTGEGLTAQTVAQPPSTCVDSCNEYHRLFTNVDVTTDVVTPSGRRLLDAASGGTLAVKATADGVSTDHCGAGHNLKVVFILSY